MVAAADPFTGRLASTSAVVTEAMHFVSAAPNGPRLLSDLLHAWNVEMYDFSAPAGLHHVVDLMEQYRTVPMDFADATLVLLAEQLGVHDILTLDRRGFAAYRTPSGRSFQNVLES